MNIRNLFIRKKDMSSLITASSTQLKHRRVNLAKKTKEYRASVAYTKYCELIAHTILEQINTKLVKIGSDNSYSTQRNLNAGYIEFCIDDWKKLLGEEYIEYIQYAPSLLCKDKFLPKVLSDYVTPALEKKGFIAKYNKLSIYPTYRVYF